MSAQSILSIPAPAMPVAPQGATSAAVSGFEGLLAAMLQMTDADEIAAVKTANAPEVDAEKVIGFLAAPPPAPPMETPPALEAGAAVASPPAEAPTPEPGPPSAGAEPPAPVKAADVTEEAPADTQDASSPDAPVAPAGEDLEAAVIAGKAAETAAQAKAATQSAPVQGSQAAPPPLRALAERTSKPVEETAKDPGAPPEAGKAAVVVDAAPDAASVFDLAMATGSAVSSPPPQTEAEAPPMDALPAGEGEAAAPQTATTHAARETSPSAMSRVAVEATAQIAAQIIRRLEGRSTRFEMSLLPEELGRVDVKLEIGADGRLAARLAFDNPLAATDLRGRADELRRELEAQGFQMADDAFEFAERDSGSHAFDRGQDSRNGNGRAFSAAARLNAEADVVQPRWTQLSLSPTGVDLKV